MNKPPNHNCHRLTASAYCTQPCYYRGASPTFTNSKSPLSQARCKGVGHCVTRCLNGTAGKLSVVKGRFTSAPFSISSCSHTYTFNACVNEGYIHLVQLHTTYNCIGDCMQVTRMQGCDAGSTVGTKEMPAARAASQNCQPGWIRLMSLS